jgi:hypothetical protein
MKSLRWCVVLTLVVGLILPVAPAIADTQLPIWEPCSVNSAIPCIESFSILTSDGKVLPGKLSGVKNQINSGFAGYPFSGVDYEWDVPGAIEPSGNSRYDLSGEYFPRGTPYCWQANQDRSTCQTGVDELALKVIPSPWAASPPTIHFPRLASDKVCGPVTAPDLCHINWDLNSNYTYRVTLRVPDVFTPSMMAAEGQNGNISYVHNSDGTNSITVTGAPIREEWRVDNPPLTPPADDQSLAVGEASALSFYIQSTQSDQAQWTNRCLSGQLVSYWHNSGIGTYPQWSQSDSAIVMQTGGQHFAPDGSLNQGFIQLNIPVAMAKCLWGVDLSRAVSATMTATYGDAASAEVITTTAKLIGNNYVLTSGGFHYSSPTIKVKMLQDPVKVSTNSQSATKVTTIKCVKGRASKSVTGANPHCPSGYILHKL